jgi:hypothetical protein
MPWLDRWLGKNPWCPIKFATFDNAAFYSFQRVMERQAQPEKQKHGDFLDNFLEAKETHPDIVGDNEIVSYIMMNVSQHLNFPSKAPVSSMTDTVPNRSSLAGTPQPLSRKPSLTTSSNTPLSTRSLSPNSTPPTSPSLLAMSRPVIYPT